MVGVTYQETGFSSVRILSLPPPRQNKMEKVLASSNVRVSRESLNCKSWYLVGALLVHLTLIYRMGRRIICEILFCGFELIWLPTIELIKMQIFTGIRIPWPMSVLIVFIIFLLYLICMQMIGTSTRWTIQRVVENKTVAEQLHFKISTLFLHGGKIIEAISWFRKHSAWYKRFVGSPRSYFSSLGMDK